MTSYGFHDALHLPRETPCIFSHTTNENTFDFHYLNLVEEGNGFRGREISTISSIQPLQHWFAREMTSLLIHHQQGLRWRTATSSKSFDLAHSFGTSKNKLSNAKPYQSGFVVSAETSIGNLGSHCLPSSVATNNLLGEGYFTITDNMLRQDKCQQQQLLTSWLEISVTIVGCNIS